VAFEFWEEKLLGTYKDRVTLALAPQTARIVLIHRLPDRPQVIATNMHVLGGYHEIQRLAWDAGRLLLSGRYQRAPGLDGKAYIYVPDGFRLRQDFSPTKGTASPISAGKNLWVHEVRFQEEPLDWAITFERTSP